MTLHNNLIIYNFPAVYYLQLQYVQSFHNIKHLNMKPDWSQRSKVWTNFHIEAYDTNMTFLLTLSRSVTSD